jgi:hypothetical protein
VLGFIRKPKKRLTIFLHSFILVYDKSVEI